jgi:uncharacterized protein (DUF302 family)
MISKILQAVMPKKRMIDMFTFKIEGKLSADQTAARVEALCQEYNFALLTTYIYHDIVESKGFPISRKVFIYNVCQAKTASMMLTTNPEFSTFMPCTLAIYEENGKTVISTMNMGLMLKAIKSNKELYDQAASLFQILVSLMRKLGAEK